MKAQDYLRQIEKINSLIESTQSEIDFWKAMATKTTVNMNGERVQSSGSKDSISEAVCKYVDKEKELDAYIDSLADTKNEIIETIRQLPSNEFKILHKKYIGKVIKFPASADDPVQVKYLTWDEIADEMNKSRRWVTDAHGRALIKVQKILDERKNNENQT